jgi:hypothetical protein
MVTALDLTHDPANGFDSYHFAEVLRTHRDNRTKYVISNKRIFSSYPSGDRAAWEWGTYTGKDPHTGHAHVSVLDAPVSDTSTPWNLEGMSTMSISDVRSGIAEMTDEGARRSTPTGRSYADDFNLMVSAALGDEVAKLVAKLDEVLAGLSTLTARIPTDLAARLDAILAAALDDDNTTVTLPPDALATLEEIKAMLAEVPTAEQNADAVVAEIAS